MAADDTTGGAGIHISEVGSFFAGGSVATLVDQVKQEVQVARHGPARTVDLNGDYITGQCYVQYMRQVAPRFEGPVMFWHGGAMTGVTWETTPDGRPGWQNHFLKAGFDTYVCDAVERGRSGWSPYPQIYTEAPIFRTQNEAWELFRFGLTEDYATDPSGRRPFDGLQFPIDRLEVLSAQFVPRWSTHGAMSLDAYFEALERVGPVWLIAHSQGGNLALEAVARHPEFFRGVILVEPASAPAEIGAAAEVPHLFVWGDYIAQSPIWKAYRATVDHYTDQLQAAEGDLTVIDLPAEGIAGNSHLLMMDRNAYEIAQKLVRWIESRTPLGVMTPHTEQDRRP